MVRKSTIAVLALEIILSLALRINSRTAIASPTPVIPKIQEQADINKIRRLYFQAAKKNDSKSIEQVLEILEDLLAKFPENPQLLTYYGSTKLLEAKGAFFPWKKEALAKEGLNYLDQAIEISPKNPEILFLRGLSSRELPSFFNRKNQAREDFAVAAQKTIVDEKTIVPELGAGACYYHGLNLLESKDFSAAKVFLEKAIEICPTSDFAQQAADILAEKK